MLKKPWTTLLAVATFAASGLSVQAAGTFANGDIIFAVRSIGTGGSTNPNVYLFDLGTSLPAASATLATGLGSELATAFGAGWYTDANLQWGVFGYTTTGSGLNLKYQVYATQQEVPTGTPAPGYTGFNQTQLNQAGSDIKQVDSQGRNGSDAPGYTSGGFTAAGAAVVLGSDPNGYVSYQPGGSVTNSFGMFNPTIEGNGFTGTNLDIFYNNFVGTSSSSVYSGTFSVTSNGNVNFTAPAAAPEPAQTALLGLGLVGLLMRRRRAAVKAA